MHGMTFRTLVAPLAGAVIYLLSAPWPYAAAGTPLVEQLAARAIAVSGTEDAGPIGIYIERWSSDEEVENLRQALGRGDQAGALDAIRKPRRRAGVMLLPGIQGHGARTRTRTPKHLLFAREISTPAGRRVIVASDERLGIGDSRIDARKKVYEFSLVDIRFTSEGVGIGKLASARDVGWDPTTGSLEVRNYLERPARLIEVRPARH